MIRVLAAAALLLVALGAGASADELVTATAAIDRDSITIGDPIALTVTVEARPGYQVTDPGVARVIGSLDVLSTEAAQQTRLAGGSTRLVFRYRITSYAVGDTVLPPIEIHFVGPRGEAGVARTEERAIRVASVILPDEDTSDIKPLKPQLIVGTSLAAELRRWAPVAGGVLALVLLAGVAFWLRRRGAAAHSGLTPAERALAELERVAALSLPEKGRVAEHYELVGAVLRRYVAEQYGLPAHERTPRELRLEMERAGVDPQQRSTIFEVLNEGESTRFGRGRAYPAHARGSLRAALTAMQRAAVNERVALTHVQAEP